LCNELPGRVSGLMKTALSKKLVIVGCGMATGRLLDELSCHQHHWHITVIGDEPEGSYNRIMLSPVLAGETDADAIIQKDANWFATQKIDFLCGRVSAINRQSRKLTLAGGQELAFDHLVLATGSSPAQIAAANQQLTGIFSFRTLQDVDVIADQAGQSRSALVVGGGLLGLEAAYGLALKGIPVTLVHRSHWLLNRQLDKASGMALQKLMESKGISFRLGTEVDSFSGQQGRVESACLTNGEILDAELVVIATGISPNTSLAQAAGLSCHRAVEVDDRMMTSDSAISALGECCEFEGHTFGLVEPIWGQCETLAAHLAGRQARPYCLKPVATKLKVSGVQLFSAGEHMTRAEHRELVMSDPASGVYRKLLLTDNRIVGIVLFGDTRDGQHYFDLMQDRADVGDQLPLLLLGKHFLINKEALPGQKNASREVA